MHASVMTALDDVGCAAGADNSGVYITGHSLGHYVNGIFPSNSDHNLTPVQSAHTQICTYR